MAGQNKVNTADLGEDGLKALREFFEARFAGDPTIRRAVVGVLDSIIEGWQSSGSMSPDSFESLKARLTPRFDALASLPTTDCKPQCDGLVDDWEDLAPQISWG